jgi:hypothetical protein
LLRLTGEVDVVIPPEGWVGFALSALVLTASIVAQPARIFLIACVCRIFKVPRKQVAEFALAEAQRGHPSPVREVILAIAGLVAATRGKSQKSGIPDARDGDEEVVGRRQ